MTSLYEVLKAQKMGAAIAPDYFTALWAGATGGGGWEVIEYTGAVPVEITASGEPLLDYLISGNMQQTGTPSPQNVIFPEETGERTAQLFDIKNDIEPYYVSTDRGKYAPTAPSSRLALIKCLPNTTYTITVFSRTFRTAFYTSKPTDNQDAAEFYNNDYGTYGTHTISYTSPSNAQYMAFFCYNSSTEYTDNYSEEDIFSTLMINLGSAPQPIEPYGYKLPFVSGDTTTPIYLGEVPTTRVIKKLVLTGEEDIIEVTSGNLYLAYDLYNAPNMAVLDIGVCTHYPYAVITSTNTNAGFAIQNRSGNTKTSLLIRWTDTTTAANFKVYLQQQYANGTPVTVWYVLATEQTGIVNEPIRKIGDYSDSISMEQAGVSIPTVSGANVVDVETTLKPSQIYLKYKGRSDS